MSNKDNAGRDALGKFFYDLAKLVFASMVLVGGISLLTDEPQLKHVLLLFLGLSFTSLLAFIGYFILKD